MPDWGERQADLAALAQRQLFFVGGAPRSGTTWLQQMLDTHPEVSCRGEGLFQNQLANPLEALMAGRRDALIAKNTALFRHTGGYPLPVPDDTEHLVATAILLALDRQRGGKPCLAVGEKTPENVFFFPRLLRLFPTAKFIGIARDPRDVLASAWHFFHQPTPGEDVAAAKLAFAARALPSLNEGAQAMLALADRHPDKVAITTYEVLLQDPVPVLAALFRFLGVSDASALVAHCVDRNSFASASTAQPTGDGAFFRKGRAGDWSATVPPAINALVVQELGWMFPRFGWTEA